MNNSHDNQTTTSQAADLVRQKLHQLYADEPNARQEVQESQAVRGRRSRHQQFVYDLSRSGKSLAEIQTAWHNYYVGLPDTEKHRVWQEFYDEHNRHSGSPQQSSPASHSMPPQPMLNPAASYASKDPRHVGDIKQQLMHNVHGRARRKRGHLKSLAFGLSSGLIVAVILLFGFFNERFIAPFITPSKAISNTAIIIDPNSAAVGPDSKIIIPKINVEIPVVYDEPSIDDAAVHTALDRGVLHYATTPSPGELGNGVIFGHSANNIFNKGKYKFAFVLLKRLEVGDNFMLQKNGKQYVYRVFAKRIVSPNDVSVIADSQGKAATFTLITCDPPGTSINRLVVTGEQITPDPAANVASSVKGTQPLPKTLPSNSQTLWDRFTRWITS